MAYRPDPVRVYGHWLLAAAGLSLAAAAIGYGIPKVLPTFHLDPLALGLIYAVIALGLNIVNGQAGQFSKLIHALSQKDITLNRKVLADLAMNHPEAFKAVVAKIK